MKKIETEVAIHLQLIVCVCFVVNWKVQTKTVAQCVEFYYTYKKQVKVGRNGILTFGPPDSPVEKHTEAVVDIKVRLAHTGVKVTWFMLQPLQYVLNQVCLEEDNTSGNGLQNQPKHSLGLKGSLIRFGWLAVKGQGHN